MIGLGFNAGKQHLGCMKTAKSPESSMTGFHKTFSNQTSHLIAFLRFETATPSNRGKEKYDIS